MTEISPELTPGAISRIRMSEKVDKPVLQLQNIIQGTKDDPNGRYLLTLSDGVHSYDYCIVQSAPLIRRLNSGEFNKLSTVVLNDYKYLKMPQFLYVNDMSVLKTGQQTATESNIESEVVPTPEEQDNRQTSSQTSNQTSIVSNPSQVSRAKPYFAINSQPMSSPTHTSTLGPSDVQPINTITESSQQNPWIIRGRVTSKPKKRKWENHNGKGSIFTFVMSDQSGEILVKAYNRLCDKYLRVIEENKVYRINGGDIRRADKRFSNLSNDFEIFLTSVSKVEECPPEEAFYVNVSKPRYQFVSIKDLDNITIGSVVDVIGAVSQVGQCYWVTCKKGSNEQMAVRDIILMDNTGADISLTLWKETAEQFECQINDIIAVKGAALKEFGGRSLKTFPNTDIKIAPDVPEVTAIKEWLSEQSRLNKTSDSTIIETTGAQTSRPNPITPSITRSPQRSGIILTLLGDINEYSLQKQSIYYVRSRVSFPVNRSPIYKACHRSRCFKKLEEMLGGVYRCSKCAEETERFQWRYCLSAVVIDCTAEKWIHMFDAEATRMMGRTAQELSEITEQEQYEEALHSIEFKTFYWKIRAKLNRYMNKTEVNLNVIDFWPSDPIKDCKALIKRIRLFAQNNS